MDYERVRVRWGCMWNTLSHASHNPLYCAAMECVEIQRLRQRASQINQELMQRWRNTRAYLARSAPGQPITADYEWFLRRRLQKAGAEIEQHLAQHKCQD